MVAEWDTIEISGVTQTELDGVVGRTIAQIAADTGREPFAAFVDVLLRDELGTGILQHVGHEENVQAIMRHPRHTGGSDGLLVGAKPHPRAWGTFPRYLGHYCRDLGVFSLEECVGHLTGRAAARLRLRDRGLVEPGTPRTWCCSTLPRSPTRPPTTTRGSLPSASPTCSSTASSRWTTGSAPPRSPVARSPPPGRSRRMTPTPSSER